MAASTLRLHASETTAKPGVARNRNHSGERRRGGAGRRPRYRGAPRHDRAGRAREPSRGSHSDGRGFEGRSRGRRVGRRISIHAQGRRLAEELGQAHAPRSPRGGAPAGGSTRILFYPTRPRGDDAHSPASSSGTSRGSPDENQNASQIPGSSGRRRSFTDGFTPPSADPDASPPAPNRVSVSPFEQRRRQALLEKQRRFARR